MVAIRSFIVLAMLLAGCASEPPRLERDAFGPLAVHLSAAVGETPPNVTVSWSPDGIVVASDRDGEVPMGIRALGSDLLVTHAGVHWTRHLPGSPRSRLAESIVDQWDLPGLLARRDVRVSLTTAGAEALVNATGSLQGAAFELAIVERDGRVISARLDGPALHEAPFAFTPAAVSPNVSAVPPGDWRRDEVVAPNDAAGAQNAATLVDLVDRDARRHGGDLPAHLSPSLADATVAWPMNPYSDTPLTEGVGPGDVSWTRCGANSARMVVHAWDGDIMERSWGAGCA